MHDASSKTDGITDYYVRKEILIISNALLR